MKIAVIGGGIGGLTVALALARAGQQQVIVYDRTPEIKEVGAALTIWPNAVRVLQRLGLEERVSSLGMEAHYRTIQTWQGSVLSRIHVDQIAGSPLQLIHRADLQMALLQAVKEAGIPIKLQKQCVGLRQDKNGVDVSFADGTTERSDVLIGADGIRSVVRQHLFGKPQIQYTGYTSWRGIAPVKEEIIPFGISSETWGVGRRIGLIPLKEDRMYWFAAQTAPEREGKETSADGHKHHLQALFHGWHQPIEEVLEATEAATIIRTNVYNMAPLPQWSVERVVLVGDAAHAMSPNMGQGGCQAIEDAPALAESLQTYGTDYATAFREYERQRKPRVTRVAQRSDWIGKLSQVNQPFLYAVRNVAVKAAYTSALTKELQWLLRV